MSQGLSSNLQKQSGKYPKITWVVFMCSSKRALEHPLPETKERTWASFLFLSILKYWFFFFKENMCHPWLNVKLGFISLGCKTVKVNQCFVLDYAAQNSPVDSENIQTSASHSSLPRLPQDKRSEHRIHLSCGSCHSHYQHYAFSYHFYLWYIFICKLDIVRE